MAEPEDFTLVLLREIQATLADHSRQFELLDQRLTSIETRMQRIEQRFHDLGRLTTYSLGESAEVKFRQTQQQMKLDELFARLEELIPNGPHTSA